MTRKITYTSQFGREVRLALQGGFQIKWLKETVTLLATDAALPRHKDNAMDGEMSGYRKYRITPEWLLVYGKGTDGELHILNLLHTGIG